MIGHAAKEQAAVLADSADEMEADVERAEVISDMQSITTREA